MRMVELGDVATIDRRGVDPRALPGDTPYLGLEHIERGGRIVGRSTLAGSEVASTKFSFSQAHVLFGKLRPNLGKVCRPDFDGVCSTDILPIKPGPALNRDYLTHYLAQPAMVQFAASRAAGANLPRLSPGVLATFPIPLPSLDEQVRIAAILDQADSIRTKRREALAHLDTLTQSIFHTMFGALPATHVVEGIAERIRTGPFGSQLRHDEFVDDGVAVLGLDNVVANRFEWKERRYVTQTKYASLTRYTVRSGDVLVSIMGTTGRCVVVPPDIPLSITTKHLCAITPAEGVVEPEFLRAAFLWHPDSRAHLVRQTKGSIMAGLNMGIVRAMPIPLPPFDLQQEFTNQAAETERHRASLLRAVAADDELFASLQSRAFRGEL